MAEDTAMVRAHLINTVLGFRACGIALLRRRLWAKQPYVREVAKRKRTIFKVGVRNHAL